MGAASKGHRRLFLLMQLVWRLQRLAGPGAWALRPARWRWVALGMRHKKGSLADIASWWLLFVSRMAAGAWLVVASVYHSSVHF